MIFFSEIAGLFSEIDAKWVPNLRVLKQLQLLMFLLITLQNLEMLILVKKKVNIDDNDDSKNQGEEECVIKKKRQKTSIV